MKARAFLTAALLLSLTRAAGAQTPWRIIGDETTQPPPVTIPGVPTPRAVRPETEDAFINCLRFDAAEQWRYDAAVALGKGQWCTKKTLVALFFAASGGTADGGIEEWSGRVKAAATQALEVCVCRMVDQANKPAPADANEANAGVQLAAYYKETLASFTESQVIDQVYRLLAETVSANPAPAIKPAISHTVPEGRLSPTAPVPLATRPAFPWPMWPTTPTRTLGPPW
ncbi:MAG TPA: hypothetical protein VE988_04110 [Gemmataceae bacterium]|nr:hypothetical protein [Gemmataceae bacterium]